MAEGLNNHVTSSPDQKATTERTSGRREAGKAMRGNAPRSFYLISASRDHVLSARKQSIVQANHGVKAPMERLRPGDGVAFYSARHQLKGKEPCQRFTAMATVADGHVFQERVTETFKPWRRVAVFEEGFKEIDINDVLGDLECLGKGKGKWGVYLRRGFIRMTRLDWEVLVAARR